ncbi:anchor protein [Opitutaceae bacterium TAV5]|nr:anchor protein [Opitutaceae bacterium TAV5]
MNIMNTKSAIRLTSATLAALGLLAAAALRADNINQTRTAAVNESWATPALWSNNAEASPGNAYFTNGYTLRTPNVTTEANQTFPGASLTVDGDGGSGGGGAMGTLSLKSRVTTIADLRLGTALISNAASDGSGNTLATLNVTDLTVLDGKTATLNGTNSNQNIYLNVTNLLGSGTLSINNTARTYTLAIDDATAFTGIISTLGGNATLVIASDLNLINGAFSVNTVTSLVLNKNLVVPSFTFGSVTLNTLGEAYTAAQLNDHFGTTAFSGTGSLIVASSTIPEPASVATLLAAAVMLAVTLRRRR